MTNPSVISGAWTPDLYIYRMVNLEVKETNKESMGVFVFSNTTKTINYFYEVAVVIGCPMTFATFPHDEQTCTFEMADVKAPWKKNETMTVQVKSLIFGERKKFLPTEQRFNYQAS